MKPLIILVYIAMLFIAGCATTQPYTPPQTVDELRGFYTQYNRVAAVTHNILVASDPICSSHKAECGFISMTLNEQESVEQQALGVKAFHLRKQPTVTYVIPGSAAERAGMLAGDVIFSINDYRWQDDSSRDAFAKQLNQAQQAPQQRLGIRRGEAGRTLSLTADQACDYTFVFNQTHEVKAMALNRAISVDYGAANMLTSDDELAFFIAHELAHILLGHTLPDRLKEIDDFKKRSVMEKDADALGIRLMIHAGYDPKGAETALTRTDLIDSGPVTRFLNYHGPYMALDERIRYLREVVNQ